MSWRGGTEPARLEPGGTSGLILPLILQWFWSTREEFRSDTDQNLPVLH
jgi:hypothetical protein